jgi:hypothetical protein
MEKPSSKKELHNLGRFVSTIYMCTTLLLLLIGTLVFISCGSTLKQFRTPLFEAGRKSNYGATGLTYNGRDLVMVGKANLIYSVNDIHLKIYDGERLGNPEGDYTIASDPINPERRSSEICGLTWEGACCGEGYLWAADATNKEIVKMDKRGNIVKTLPAPCNRPSALAFNGQTLWIADEVEGKIYNISPDDGTLLKTLTSPMAHPAGMTWAYNYLWVVGTTGFTTPEKTYKTVLYRINTESGSTFGTTRLEPITKPSAMTFADDHLWISDYNKNRIFVYKPSF